jgi:hypothetical protein
MNTATPVSKVLILDDSAEHAEVIKRFCEDNNLIGLKVHRNRLASVLRSNIDLGGVLLSESYGGSIQESAAVAARIDALRPELPIILRRDHENGTEGLPEVLRDTVCATYLASEMDALHSVIGEYIFSLEYPNALVRGISEITESRIHTIFKDLDLRAEQPCIVRDRIIFGEVFSLIPLESAWCRGYMLIQAEEQPLLDILAQSEDGNAADFRDLNSLLGELTNLVWGAFKDRYLAGASDRPASQVQVPLLINHKQRYISFGSSNPQLCFKYRLTDPESGNTVSLDQRFIFSLSWSPEDFSEQEADVHSLVEAGELDLF